MDTSYVYCGPTVRGVARQFTVYTYGLTGPIKEFLEAHPEAKALLVPLDRFAETRLRLEKKGTWEALLYQALKASL